MNKAVVGRIWKENFYVGQEFVNSQLIKDMDQSSFFSMSVYNHFLTRNFSTVFCLKINHGGAFTKPPKICYKGGKVNWTDTIDSDEFFVNEGLRKLATDSDVLEMLKFVPKYKVIDLYVEHSVTKEPMNIDHFISKAIILYEPNNLDEFMDNDADEVLDDVSEVEWLQESLRKLPRFSQSGGQSSNNVDNVGDAVSEHEFESEYRSDIDDSDFIVDEENLIHDVAVNMQDSNNTDVNVEWMGCKEFVQEVNEMFHAEEDIDFKDFEDFDSGTNSDNEGVRKKAIRN
uniref:Transposase, MuDR n=1 Tax=Tanacetum cinerariifolium TaxID=118510 RepID=A0A6L2KT32_TANCI|nr:transposase, MuDR [Tanacetum cinerariifolium]